MSAQSNFVIGSNLVVVRLADRVDHGREVGLPVSLISR